MSAAREYDADVASTVVSSQIEAILASAQRAGAELAQEVEAAAMQRGAEIIEDAKAQADQMTEELGRRATEYMAEVRERVDAFAAERIERLNELTDSLITAAESIDARFARADVVREQLNALITTIGSVAEAVAREQAIVPPLVPAPVGPGDQR